MLHCGPCGACTNAQDMGVYVRTAANLTDLAGACGLRLRHSQRMACLAAIGFTAPCAQCFEDNIVCDRRACLRPCLAFAARERLWRAWAWLQRALGRTPAPGPMQELHRLATNACLACDEENCGPAFMACAGANRRRAGIPSDIERQGDELCSAAVLYERRSTSSDAGAGLD